jgi:hypothetical protein
VLFPLEKGGRGISYRPSPRSRMTELYPPATYIHDTGATYFLLYVSTACTARDTSRGPLVVVELLGCGSTSITEREREREREREHTSCSHVTSASPAHLRRERAGILMQFLRSCEVSGKDIISGTAINMQLVSAACSSCRHAVLA